MLKTRFFFYLINLKTDISFFIYILIETYPRAAQMKPNKIQRENPIQCPDIVSQILYESRQSQNNKQMNI